MDDLVKKIDRAKELVGLARTDMNRDQEEACAAELLDLAVDAASELVANSHRIAVALETIAANTKPVAIQAASAELISGPSLTDQLASFDWSNIGFLMGQGFANGDRSAR